MADMSRRAVMAGAGMALVPVGGASAEAAGDAVKAAPPEVTRILARYIVEARYDDLPANVRKEGVRTLLNYVGVAVGGSDHETIDIAVAALTRYSGPPQAGLFGRPERFDIMNAAFINGVSSHIFDYDDTHLKTIIHPGGPVISAILALAEMKLVSGKDFLNALVLGVRPSAGLAIPSIPTTTTPVGTSPARPAYSARPRRRADSWGSPNSRWFGPWDWPRLSRWACANRSAR
jgi:MmgE/PrpD N-terminal domain